MRNPYRAIFEHFRQRHSASEWLTAEAFWRYGGASIM
jgi:hypothetical protein